jgi:cell division initiation protein
MLYKNYTKPEELVSKSFPTKLRGYSESEVKLYLKKLSLELSELHTELTELQNSEQASNNEVQAQSNDEIISTFSQETAKVLQSAKDSADKLVKEANENAEKIISEANAQQELIISQADEYKNKSESESLQEIDLAKSKAQDYVDNLLAKCESSKDKIIEDYEKRKELLEEQCENLRSNKDELLNQLKVVKDLLDKSTKELKDISTQAQAIGVGEIASDEKVLYSEIDKKSVAIKKETTEQNVTSTKEEKTSVKDKIDKRSESKKALDPEIETIDTENVPESPSKGIFDIEEMDSEKISSEKETQQSIVEDTQKPIKVEKPKKVVPEVPEKKPETKLERSSSNKEPASVGKVKKTGEELSKIIKKISRDEQNDLLQILRTKKKATSFEDVIPDKKTQAKPYVTQTGDFFKTLIGSKPKDADISKWSEMVIAPLHEKINEQAKLADKEDLDLSDSIASIYRLWRRDDLQSLAEDVVIESGANL